MLLQAATRFLAALTTLASGASQPPGTLQITESEPQGGNAPQNLASNSQVTDLINTAGSFTN